ncbi:MAG: ABC transporter ATP-binding protein [Deltaproteobacteria bacterium]|nr:ABC transporter ATP-binding protein [Deltaproteobacteria bacterium]
MGNIVVNNIGKKYKRYPNNWARLAEWLAGGRYCTHEDRWALRGVTFEVQSGEAVGIVGQNGAGKSTLLKILTGTTQLNEGTIQVKGRVAALLELGMGFHQDFTGRENALMACQMTGMNSQEMQTLLPEIEEFSELGDYMDQPLRVYSTGMQMRLAFSAATALRPEILIVDEALSVGDVYFQHKCMRRIRSFKEKGTTLLFVSHDPGAVKSLCDRALLLDEGVLIRDGDPDAVLDYYNGMIAKKTKDEEIRQVETELGRTITRSGNKEARILKVEMFDGTGRPARAFRVGDNARISCHIAFNTPMENPTVGISIRDRLGNDVFGTNTYHLKIEKHSYKAGEGTNVVFYLPLNLGCGNYSLTVAVHTRDTHLENNYDWWDQCLVFQVIPNESFSFIGLAAIPVEVKIQKEISR